MLLDLLFLPAEFTMAEVVLSAIVSDLVSRAISLLIGRFSCQRTSDFKLQQICHMLIRIHSVVEEAKGRQITNHGTLQWLSDLIDGEYQGRYLLDTVRCGEHEFEDEQRDMVVPQISTVSFFNPAKRMRVAGCAMKSILARRHDIDADDIDRVLQRLRGVSDDIREFIMLLQSCQPISRPLATNIFRDGQIFGRHVEKEKIINFLLHDGNCSTGELGVLPVVGDIGVGKTTLVQHACDDARVRNHFPVIMLCCTYSVSTNGISVLQSKLAIGDAGISTNDPQQLFKGNLGNKRFLMVFEDIDMHKKQMLEGLLPSLRCGKEGSKIIITTNNRVAATIGTVEPIILKVLPSPEYWFFFKAHAFAGRDVGENPRLLVAGKAIARKLNGSFFGAKIVGGMLRDHPDPRFWCKVLSSNIGGLFLLGDAIAYISDLADNMLPGHVEVCNVTIFKGPFSSQTTELTKLQDLCSSAPHGSRIACWTDDIRFRNVLLCKSVLPFYNCYYVACCTCTCTVHSANYYSKST